MSDMMTVTELAERWKINRKTVLNYIHQRRLPAIQTPGGNYRIRREVVEAWEQDSGDGKESGDTRRSRDAMEN